MDPLSITAGSIAVLSALTASGKGINRLVSLKRAPAELLALSNEIESLRALLLVVQLALINVRDTAAYTSCKELFGLILGDVGSTVLDLESKIEFQLKRADVVAQDGRPKISRIAWLKADSEVERLKWRIRDARGNLSTALSAMNLHVW